MRSHPPFPLEPSDVECVPFETLVRWSVARSDPPANSVVVPQWTHDLPDELLTAMTAVRLSCRFLSGHSRIFQHSSENQRLFGARKKSDSTPITPEDLGAQKIIVSVIQKQYPKDGILTEEGFEEGKKKRRRWLIDGLDGTGEFYDGGDNFASAISLVENGNPRVSVIGSPLDDDLCQLWFAFHGKGAWRIDHGRRPYRLKVSRRNSINRVRLGTHRWVVNRVLNDTKKPLPLHQWMKRLRDQQEKWESVKEDRENGDNWVEAWDDWKWHAVNRNGRLETLGSAALMQAYVSDGRYDGYMSRTVKPWDAAGTLLIKEAGGQVTAWDNSPRDILSDGSMLATNQVLHDKIAQLLQAFL